MLMHATHVSKSASAGCLAEFVYQFTTLVRYSGRTSCCASTLVVHLSLLHSFTASYCFGLTAFAEAYVHLPIHVGLERVP